MKTTMKYTKDMMCKIMIIDCLNSRGENPDCKFYKKLKQEVYEYMSNLRIDSELLKDYLRMP